jgi:zinc/manganese transport system substrate-binding protein
MVRLIFSFSLSVFFLLPSSSGAALNVFACEPEWAALATELGGPLLDVSSGTTALQDVHQIEAKPSLIAKVRKADLVACTGAELEVGWLPQLLRQAGNQKVASGAGYFLAASQVKTLDKPSTLDRAAGDVHPQGNPHVQMDPYRVLAVAKAMSARLQKLDPSNAATYQQRLADFSGRWSAAIKRWEAKAAPLRGKKIIVHHISWVYLNSWLGLQQVGALEPKPGVPPTSGHLSELIGMAKSQGVYAIITADYQDPKPSKWLSERTGVPVATLPFSVGGDAQAKDLFGMFDSTIDKLLGAAK